MAKKKKKKHLNKFLIAIILAVIVIAILAYLILSEMQNSSSLVAKVNGEPIYESDLSLEYERLPAEYREIVVKEELLQQMIERTLVLQQAESLNVHISDEEVVYAIMLEKELVEKLSDELSIKLTAEDKALIDVGGTESLDATTLYAQGLEFEDKYDYQKAYELFKQAYDKDPDFKEAKTKMEIYRPLATG